MRTFQSPDMPVLEVETFRSYDSNEICSTWVTFGTFLGDLWHTPLANSYCQANSLFSGTDLWGNVLQLINCVTLWVSV